MLPPLLVFGPIRLCLPDICSLGSLISTTKQEKCRWTALSIVHTVARAVVNPQFPDTTADGVRIAEIAKPHTGKTSTDTGTGSGITQPQ
jgi:hypothetical protein